MLNALLSILFKVLGSFTVFKFRELAKAFFPIRVTPSGIVTLDKERSPVNA